MSITDNYKVTNIREYFENRNPRIGLFKSSPIFLALRIRMLNGF